MSGMDNKAWRIAMLALAGTLLVGCSDDDDDDTTSSFDDQALRQVVTDLGMDGDPRDQAARNIPRIEDSKAQLGMKLFFTKTLGGDEDSACVTCHHPLLGGGDDLSLPIGVQADVEDDLGPGRTHNQELAEADGMEYDGGPTVPRNAPTTFNFALYQQSVFHDGRVEVVGANDVRTPDSAFGVADPNAEDLVQGQALFPVTSPEEMASTFLGEDASREEIRTALAERLNQNPIWVEAFDAVYNLDANGGAITYAMISDAIADYEASQIFIESPWKAYVDGDNGAISLAAKQGAQLFFGSVDNGGAGCASCHSGDFFTDEDFHNVAIPQIGRGKGDGLEKNDDFGRFRETGLEEDMYAFRTPTLLNVTATGPYGRVGSYDSLEAVVRHHLNAEPAVMAYDFTLGHLAQSETLTIQHENAEEYTMLALDRLKAAQADGTSLLKNVDLTDEQVGQLVSFLEALTDPCVEDAECLADWIPEVDEALDDKQVNFTLN